ncbi:hypothetical protein [uncultured Sneathiella sp.]
MFTKNVRVGGIYKRVTDWGAVFGAIFWFFVALMVLGALAG